MAQATAEMMFLSLEKNAIKKVEIADFLTALLASCFSEPSYQNIGCQPENKDRIVHSRHVAAFILSLNLRL